MLRITIVQLCGNAGMMRNANYDEGRFQADRREVFHMNSGQEERLSDRLKGL
jgi:hypothetical protein